jgi:hypothetical protein
MVDRLLKGVAGILERPMYFLLRLDIPFFVLVTLMSSPLAICSLAFFPYSRDYSYTCFQ